MKDFVARERKEQQKKFIARLNKVVFTGFWHVYGRTTAHHVIARITPEVQRMLEEERATAYETLTQFAAANDEQETVRYTTSIAAAIRRRHQRDDEQVSRAFRDH